MNKPQIAQIIADFFAYHPLRSLRLCVKFFWFFGNCRDRPIYGGMVKQVAKSMVG